MRNTNLVVFGLASIVALAAVASAADPNAVVFTDPKKAGIDFQLQGEYRG
ncbi:MAG: hypothetical protein HKN11_16670, partial [Rhizobiales bacterium]|nr:hypothetical protein [Hyphomicrobiales bacterium]